MKKLFGSYLLLSSAAVLILAAGCADEVDDRGEEGATSSVETSPDEGNGSETGENSDSGSGNDSGGQCNAGGVNQDDPCELCIAQECTVEALACCQQPGCLDVVRCAADTECGGIDCYAPDKCKTEIDAAGLDVAQEYAQPLGDCALTNCADACDQVAM
jgi:hypothetical protein